MANDNYVLGVSAYFHDSSAVLTNGYEILAAAQEERFSQIKSDPAFPNQAINYCLSHLPHGKSLKALAFYETPLVKMDRIVRNAAQFAPRGAAIWPQTLQRLKQLNETLPSALREILDDPDRIIFCGHHRSHAASAFYPSPFDQSAVLVVDGVGEWSTTSIWKGDAGGLKPVHELKFPHSLGMLYSSLTQYCGFKVNSGEFKLMGLAPFGEPVFADLIKQELIEIRSDGSFELDLKYFDFATGVKMINPLFEDLFNHVSRFPEDDITPHFRNIAASVQAVTDEIMGRLAQTAVNVGGTGNLCLAGGVALNCVSNSHIYKTVKGLNNLWVQPAAGDAGGALGAALNTAVGFHLEKIQTKQPNDDMSGAYLGPDFDEGSIKIELDRNKLPYEFYEDEQELCAVIAEALEDGETIGHFNGRAEFGPRALGNRSILADPRPAGMMNRVNQKIKFREAWRPFAPAILAEHASTYFEVPHDSPYMLLVSNLRPEFANGPTKDEVTNSGMASVVDIQGAVSTEFSAVTHVDDSSRLQTVDMNSSSRLRPILKAFYKSTGCPMVLNSSFNVRGKPIVGTPADAIECFLQTGLDVLVVGKFLIRKSTIEKVRQIRVQKDFV